MTSKLLAFLTAVQTAVTGVVGLGTDGNDKFIDGRHYAITFEDNFDGTELDTSKWKRADEQRRQDLNNYWCDEMSYLDGEGSLVLEMSYDEETDRFNSGAVETKGLFEQAYGYFEVRCTLNSKPGYWTAFWLMGDSVLSENNGGKDGTEIDIYERRSIMKKRYSIHLIGTATEKHISHRDRWSAQMCMTAIIIHSDCSGRKMSMFIISTARKDGVQTQRKQEELVRFRCMS